MKIKHLLTAGAWMLLATTACLAGPEGRPPWIAEKCVEGSVRSGSIKDEAACVGRTAESLPGADDDYFKDMDYGISQHPDKVTAALEPFVPGISKTPEAAVKAIVRGRNNWIVWTAGNDKLWDHMNINSVGSFDLLKVLSNHPELMKKPGYSRDNRWHWFGVVNEPCFKKNLDAAGKPVGRADRFGLYLDVRDPSCPPDPFEDEKKYPGVKIGARGDTVPVGSFYGYATGIVGLRLLPNPDFDAKAAKNWNAEKYYTDPKYYNDKDLVKPYRVGMSCGFCHVGPNPTHPPKDPENPTWADLNSNPGAQYFWFDRVFVYGAEPDSFAYQVLSANHPGALDTSLISTDYIVNPRTMNAVYNLGPRMKNALRVGKEKLTGGEVDNKQFNDYPAVPGDSVLQKFFNTPDTVWTPRVLKDGSDSVGALGALNRVFVNIGLFSEEWLQHINPLVGGKPLSPFPIKAAEKNSSYWKATEAQTIDTALFFLAATPPDYLKDAPDGSAHLSPDQAVLKRGKVVFAENCARCHSSKLPEESYGHFKDQGCNGPDYLGCWNSYWKWTKTPEFKAKMTEIVLKDDFAADNYLSTELRIPVTLLETNACASLATNAIKGDTWDNFSSTSYKTLPSVGKITVHDPRDGKPREYDMPAGGRGYIRPPSLTSLWSTAPFLLNNTLGKFYPSGSVEDRLKSFDSGIQQLLWPEKRSCDQKDLYAADAGYAKDYGGGKADGYYGKAGAAGGSCEDQGRTYSTRSGKKVPGIIDRTWARSSLKVPVGYLPPPLDKLPLVDGAVDIGPIPEGTPVGLIANMDLDRKDDIAHNVLAPLIADLEKAKLKAKLLPGKTDDEDLRKIFSGHDLVDRLLSVSKCPDFVINRGHYFGTDYLPKDEGETPLDEADKKALIEFLKTL
ncbi:hypothetical protein MYXO_01554 [Myxococcaceae bacterium]|nr:hypothetical protein MYXO_01554 [Myxococcaceae bacterium]